MNKAAFPYKAIIMLWHTTVKHGELLLHLLYEDKTLGMRLLLTGPHKLGKGYTPRADHDLGHLDHLDPVSAVTICRAGYMCAEHRSNPGKTKCQVIQSPGNLS